MTGRGIVSKSLLVHITEPERNKITPESPQRHLQDLTRKSTFVQHFNALSGCSSRAVVCSTVVYSASSRRKLLATSTACADCLLHGAGARTTAARRGCRSSSLSGPRHVHSKAAMETHEDSKHRKMESGEGRGRSGGRRRADAKGFDVESSLCIGNAVQGETDSHVS